MAPTGTCFFPCLPAREVRPKQASQPAMAVPTTTLADLEALSVEDLVARKSQLEAAVAAVDSELQRRQLVSTASASSSAPPASAGKKWWIHLGTSKFPLVMPAANFGTGDTGLRLWVASLVLAGYLLEEGAHLVRGHSVLELGAGASALPTIVASKVGARLCVATDYTRELAAMARANLEVNAVDRISSVDVLDWEDVVAKAGTGRVPRSWEVILFADTVYTVEMGTLLASCLQALVPPQGRAIGVISSLRVGGAEFVRSMSRFGFVAENLPFSDALRTQIDEGAVLGPSTTKADLAAMIEGLPAVSCFMVSWRRRDGGVQTPPDDTEAIWQGLSESLSNAESKIRMSDGFEVWE